MRTRAQRKRIRRCVSVETDVHRMRRDTFSSHSDSIEMFTAAEAVLRKRWRKLLARGARTHSVWLAFSVCATGQKKPCKFTGKFCQPKVQSPVSLVSWEARHCHYRGSLSRQERAKNDKTTRRYKNDSCDRNSSRPRAFKKRITWR